MVQVEIVQLTMTRKQFKAVSMCILAKFAEFENRNEAFQGIVHDFARANFDALSKEEKDEVALMFQDIHKTYAQRARG